MATIRHLLVVCGVMGASALDLTWLPADPDGPLPLSTKFRESLARLCDDLAVPKLSEHPEEPGSSCHGSMPPLSID